MTRKGRVEAFGPPFSWPIEWKEIETKFRMADFFDQISPIGLRIVETFGIMAEGNAPETMSVETTP
ncbi:hypothetical protein [Azospirillum canadense]|uniref:hypothetical protein n=1 Tax=Azospirillum canadense TaxID=403962 RepID=UPI002226DD75|nr:hypothetical protein [Azospirillum canadense]MCW2237825.1 hypothetical protein [Azospirillum canadense]